MVLAALAKCGLLQATVFTRIDPLFNARLHSNSVVTALAVEPNGNLLVGGRLEFETRAHPMGLVRLSHGGLLDPSFRLLPFSGVKRIVLQPDGKILVSGELSIGRQVGGLIRLNRDGSHDTTFSSYGSLGNIRPRAVAVHPNGFIYAADEELTGEPGALRRLRPDGSLDARFSMNGSLELPDDGYVADLAIRRDGSVLVAGRFYGYSGSTRPSILRVAEDGSLTAFNPGPAIWEALNGGRAGGVNRLVLLPSGRMALSVSMSNPGERLRTAMILLGSHGAILDYTLLTNGNARLLDPFERDEASRPIMLVGGSFTTAGGFTQTNLAYTGSSMHFPSYMAPPVQLGVFGVGGEFYIGGEFDSAESFPRTALARITPVSVGTPAQNYVRPVEKFVSEGEAVVLTAPIEPVRWPQPTYRWMRDGTPVTELSPTNISLTLPVVTSDHTGNYYVEARDPWTMTVIRSAPIQLTVPAGGPGAVDPSFVPRSLPNVSSVFGGNLVLIPTGGAYASRSHYFRDGTELHRIVRFNEKGDEDASFTNSFGGPAAFVQSADGSLIVLAPRRRRAAPRELLKVRPDGSENFEFRPLFGRASGAPELLHIDVDPNGRILVSGAFDTVNGVARANLARLLPSGELDTTFAPFTLSFLPHEGVIKALASGDVIVTRSTGVRLKEDGSRSVTPFRAPAFLVEAFEVQRDRMLVVGFGSRTASLDGFTQRKAIARLLPNWTEYDPGFQPQVDRGVLALDIQPDGRIVIGGDFLTVNGAQTHGIARLHADGSLDSSFHRGRALAGVPGGAIASVQIDGSGRTWIAGFFDQVDGIPRQGVARLTGGAAPAMAFLTLNPAEGARLRVQTIAGKMHRVERRDSLSEGEWVALETFTGTGEPREITDVAPASRQRFYRVLAE